MSAASPSTATALPRVDVQRLVRRSYRRHIERLQDENRELRAALAQERLTRQRAYKWYSDRLNSRFWGLLDFMLMHRKSKS